MAWLNDTMLTALLLLTGSLFQTPAYAEEIRTLYPLNNGPVEALEDPDGRDEFPAGFLVPERIWDLERGKVKA